MQQEDKHDVIRNKIKNYVEIDDNITEINKGISTLRKSKKSIGDEIKDYMKSNGLSDLEVGTEKFTLKEVVRNKSITKKAFINGLLGVLDKEKVNEITEVMFNEDPEEEKIVSLERKK